MASTNGSDTSKHSSSPGPRVASGFRSWLKTKATIKKNVEFVQEDPGGTRQRNGGFPNVLKSQNNAHIPHSSKESSLLQSPAAHRRQQVYRAQKRHRDRKADYVQSLEAEIARLRHLDTVVNSEKGVLEHQNQAMKGFLASHNLDEGSANNHVDSSSGSRSDPSTIRSDATVDVRYDTEVGHERTFLDVEEGYADSNAGKEASNSLPDRADSLEDSTESWKALDFILALEWPCQNHIHHHAINPLSAQNGVEPALITLSSQFPVNDDMMTPAQIYSTICLELPLLSPENSSRSRIMEALKVPLSQKVSCFGFGAALPAVDFYAVFDSAMTAMSETSNTLGQ
ncbi:hypothetical protein KC340_g6241 [Hortaea werneckii]|nr:hypothetical protein KC342_g14038 [Hortaea werneckii]KAI7101340.1 hypothetical protein KC339_g6810 [Hortaea werneckii]KAI7242977.1 hypothetical protein KC365_g2685 [Hortaea werneckii]KAI7324968.1 hypothetical protein KC340_g6241 [Hortaea werneckii]